MAERIDLNCDVGESFGVYHGGNDAELLRHVTSANIACGFHAGDPAMMRKTVRLALEHNVAIGAHPGLPDLVGFGRRNMQVTPREVYEMVLYQMGALHAFVRAEGAKLSHVKPHGALYNMAARDRELATAIAEAVQRFDPSCQLVGLAGSELIHAGDALGITTVGEAFADRAYETDGSLTPRDQPFAVLCDPQEVANRVVSIVREGKVVTRQNTDLLIDARTICIHGDSPHAIHLVQAIREQLQAAKIEVAHFGS
jgi:5-oxoprolinase (ATP-hydrolysing) subunit A